MTAVSGARPCFVAFEGGEGSGKSTQAARLAARIGAVLTHEPGATALGQQLRRLLLDPDSPALDGRTEALLMAADRAQHMAEVVRPALDAGRHVITDRSALSFLAYQGWGRGLPIDALRRLSDWASEGRWPDLVFLIDTPPDVTATRLAHSAARLDRMEAEGDGFHGRVRQGFAALAADDPARWIVIDGTGSVDEVAARVDGAWQVFDAARPR